MMPRPVDNVRYEIDGRRIKSLNALQLNPVFINKYKDIRITKEDYKSVLNSK